MIFETKFEMKQKVRVVDLEKNGKITGFWIGEDKIIQYQVRFFDDGRVLECNFDEDELVEVKK